jgi:hypothetical protein
MESVDQKIHRLSLEVSWLYLMPEKPEIEALTNDGLITRSEVTPPRTLTIDYRVWPGFSEVAQVIEAILNSTPTGSDGSFLAEIRAASELCRARLAAFATDHVTARSCWPNNLVIQDCGL